MAPFTAVWLFHTGFGLPYAIYMLRNSMSNLPKELFESAYLDGAGHWQIFHENRFAPDYSGNRIPGNFPIPLGLERFVGFFGLPRRSKTSDDLSNQQYGNLTRRLASLDRCGFPIDVIAHDCLLCAPEIFRQSMMSGAVKG